MRRRSFLLSTVAGSLAAWVGPGCGGVTRSDLPRSPSARVTGNVILDAILEIASLAPSSHNSQPWAVRVESPRRLSVLSVKERWLPAVDPNNREMLLSLGAFLENLTLAAAVHGLHADIALAARNARDALVADVTLEPASPPASDADLARARFRRTLRRKLDTTPLRAADLAHLERLTGELAYVARGEGSCNYLDEVTIEANRIQAYRDDAQAELVRWIRWSNDEVEQHRDGLTLPALEVTGLTGWFARTFLSKESQLSQSSRERAVNIARDLVPNSGGWIVLGSKDDGVAELIDAGRRFQRLFLQVRERGIGLHPMSQALEEGRFREEIAARIGVPTPQFLLRIGYCGSYDNPVSPRRPIESFVG
ncbi:hypothetical protein LZC95_48680 [Pendulispora brunnea]|uniref:Nitroreductase domain-containing protein n=1 Tax=Pendulispora brunnea TaxID=2905690 RepID=A0ABZ2KB36_9BACT